VSDAAAVEYAHWAWGADASGWLTEIDNDDGAYAWGCGLCCACQGRWCAFGDDDRASV
jgi:hypothetical protein